jgi:hypothetical protein
LLMKSRFRITALKLLFVLRTRKRYSCNHTQIQGSGRDDGDTQIQERKNAGDIRSRAWVELTLTRSLR